MIAMQTSTFFPGASVPQPIRWNDSSPVINGYCIVIVYVTGRVYRTFSGVLHTISDVYESLIVDRGRQDMTQLELNHILSNDEDTARIQLCTKAQSYKNTDSILDKGPCTCSILGASPAMSVIHGYRFNRTVYQVHRAKKHDHPHIPHYAYNNSTHAHYTESCNITLSILPQHSNQS